MNWRIKARIQGLVAVLPERLAYPVYYALQRRFGGLRRVNPLQYLHNAVRLAAALRRAGATPAGRSVFELGTGRTLNSPVAFWLAGAGRITTVDLNPYLREELSDESMAWIREHPREVDEAFCPLEPGLEFQERRARLNSLPPGLRWVCELCGIEYRAPLDATRSVLPAGSFDLYVSTNVIEHVPPDVLRSLFREARRLLRPGGLMAHYIDLRDHFYTSDPSITMVNFLQFPERVWDRLAGNRFMYQNRMRVFEYRALFDELGFRPLVFETQTDERSLRVLREGLPLDPRFAGRSAEELATVGITVVGRFD